MLLDQWTETAAPAGKASIKSLRNLLLEADLFDEKVAAVLQKNITVGRLGYCTWSSFFQYFC